MNKKHFSIVVAIMVFAAVPGLLSYFSASEYKQESVKASDFPKVVGQWTSEDIPLSERVYEILETRNLIMRKYVNGEGDSINFYIIYSQDNRKISHPPEICIQGAGATITSKTSLWVTNSIQATKLSMQKEGFWGLECYWYKAGKLYTNNYLKQQLKVVFSRMFGKKTSLALIRVSTEIKDKNQDIALKRIIAFCALIEPLLDKHFP